MKQLTICMDGNGHVSTTGEAGVNGDHNCTELVFVLRHLPEDLDYYRLNFAGGNQTISSEMLHPGDGILSYTLPQSVTTLNRYVTAQLCGYKTQGNETKIKFKSDPFSLVFNSDVGDTEVLAEKGLTEEMNHILEEVESFYEEFDIVADRVTTLAPNDSATATLRRDGMQFRLDLGIPQGEKGTSSLSSGYGILVEDDIISADSDVLQRKLTATGGISLVGDVISPNTDVLQEKLLPGNRAQIVNNTLQVDSLPEVYHGIQNTYEYIGINESKSVNDLKGRLLFVRSAYNQDGTAASFYTSGEGVYQPVHCYQGGALTTLLPQDSFHQGKVMALFVTLDGKVVLLNPDRFPEPLAHYTIEVIDGGQYEFSRLDLTVDNYSIFQERVTILANTTADMPLDGRIWYGPYQCQILYYNGTNWVHTGNLTGTVLPAGSNMLMLLHYDTVNQSFQMQWLNPPIPAPLQDWKTIGSTTITGDNNQTLTVTVQAKKEGSMVSLLLSQAGDITIRIPPTTSLCSMPEEYLPTFALNNVAGLVLISPHPYNEELQKFQIDPYFHNLKVFQNEVSPYYWPIQLNYFM